MEKRKDMTAVRGIREDEDAEMRVEAIMKELGHTRITRSWEELVD